MSDENELELQDSEPLGSESSDENQDEPRSIDLQVLIREFALDGFVADESWLRREKATEEGMRNYKTWQAKWRFLQCAKLAIHFKLPNDPSDVDFDSRWYARACSLPQNRGMLDAFNDLEKRVALQQRREPEHICTQTILRNEDARTWIVDAHIARLWQSGQPIPPRSELTTTDSIKRLQTAIRARRFRRAKREENPEAV